MGRHGLRQLPVGTSSIAHAALNRLNAKPLCESGYNCPSMQAILSNQRSCIVKPVSEWTGFLAVCPENGLMSLSEDEHAALADLAQKSDYLATLEAAAL